MMVCHGIVGTTFPRHFLVGTPRTLFPCINPRQFPSTNPSLAQPATWHATSQALFPSTPASKSPSTFPNLPVHPLVQAPIPVQPTRQPRMQPRKHFSQAHRPIKISKHFCKQRTPPVLQAVRQTKSRRIFPVGSCDFPALAQKCTLRFTTNTQKNSQELSSYKNNSCRGFFFFATCVVRANAHEKLIAPSPSHPAPKWQKKQGK